MGPNSGGGKKNKDGKGKGGGKKYDKLGRPLNFGNYRNGVLVTSGGKGKGGKGNDAAGPRRGARRRAKKDDKTVAVSLSAADEDKVRGALEATAGGVERFVASRYRVGQRVSCYWEEDGEGAWYDAIVKDVSYDDEVGVYFEGLDDDEGHQVVPLAECRERAPKKRPKRAGADDAKAAGPPPPAKGSPLRAQRESLPAFEFRTRILAAIHGSRVVVVEGDTGCGKTTQVPQFVLEDAAEHGEACSVVVAQPRRISAMGVAERVAAERGEAVGSGAVGYSIRLETKTCASTCLLFCTTGILMRRLSENPDLEGVTHVFVDEVHERTIESDFLLMVLRDVLARRADLKLVLMSATLDADLFANYFPGDVPTVSIPGRAYPVAALYLEAALELTQHRVRAAGAGAPGAAGEDALAEADFAKRYRTCGRTAHAALAATNFEEINYELVVSLVSALIADFDGPDAVVAWAARKGFLKPAAAAAGLEGRPEAGLSDAILVFLPGFKEIQTLHEALLATRPFDREPQKSWVLPLHSQLPPEEQKRVFSRPPKGVRKVVLATNIAETAITIDDVSLVVDCGRMKEKRFDAEKRMESLEDVSVCRSNAKQRRGRAGRCRPGCCFHLLTSFAHDSVVAGHQTPEVKRVPLERLVLTIKALGYEKTAGAVLAALLEPPRPAAVRRAVDELATLGALETSEGREDLTALGAHLSLLPTDARIGKFILLGAIFGAVDETLTIASVLTSRSPFVAPFALRDEADAAKRSMAGATQSDHLAALRAYAEFDGIKGNGKYDLARQNFLGIKSLQQIAALKRQFLELLSDAGFAPRGGGALDDGRRGRDGRDRKSDRKARPRDDEIDAALEGLALEEPERAPDTLLKALLCAALYPQVALVETKESSSKGKGKGGGGSKLKIRDEDGAEMAVALHPSSVNARLSRFESPYVVFAEKLKTAQVYLRDTTPVSPYALMLFGGRLRGKGAGGARVLSVDDWIQFRVPGGVEKLVTGIRVQLDSLLTQKIENPDLELSAAGKGVLEAVVALLDTPAPKF
ncbi:helicase [Aureococcus anophagefferens]|nr:helicase [Aureococcus anophagefferens]